MPEYSYINSIYIFFNKIYYSICVKYSKKKKIYIWQHRIKISGKYRT